MSSTTRGAPRRVTLHSLADVTETFAAGGRVTRMDNGCVRIDGPSTSEQWQRVMRKAATIQSRQERRMRAVAVPQVRTSPRPRGAGRPAPARRRSSTSRDDGSDSDGPGDAGLTERLASIAGRLRAKGGIG